MQKHYELLDKLKDLLMQSTSAQSADAQGEDSPEASKNQSSVWKKFKSFV